MDNNSVDLRDSGLNRQNLRDQPHERSIYGEFKPMNQYNTTNTPYQEELGS